MEISSQVQTILPFKAKRRCAKCGYQDIKFSYQNEVNLIRAAMQDSRARIGIVPHQLSDRYEEVVKKQSKGITMEWINKICSRCGYTWGEECNK